MAAARGFFDQYSVFCVFGSVVGCVVVPLITQSFESIIFSAIVITLAAKKLSKHILTNEQKTHQRDGERQRIVESAPGVIKKRKKPGALSQQTVVCGYEELKRRRGEEMRKDEEARQREQDKREEDRREKKARKKIERRERKEQERIIKEREEEVKQKKIEARLRRREVQPLELEVGVHHQIPPVDITWRDHAAPTVKRASSTSSIASSSSSGSFTPNVTSPVQKRNRSFPSHRPWYCPTRQIPKPCSISFDTSGPTLTSPPPPPPPPVRAKLAEVVSPWMVSASGERKESPQLSALKVEDLHPGQLITEDLLKISVIDSPFTDPLPPFNAVDPFGLQPDETVSECFPGHFETEHGSGPRLYSLFGQETKAPMFGQLVDFKGSREEA
eukprot:m.3367 g.3367  ORF g.3367 m.3367 type:complete len:387 (+) comp9306_c0_seq2:123-1283(+)